ncbi:ABC transporter permease [Frankia sp. CcI156]|uniref:Binding-protein-dependent transport systems inner membrane component n=1 Tax=Frankia casuarinae (strain DSM 45818 / CECT 9043 / HFP020203 / CcI3) TaxID=106370 RepID=Q2JGF4_FRACC|nr:MULTISPECIES: ABC transporter permease [Frankia]ABD09638.1 binding-protein-dependent transport systems inner membrane component [Frankia casuarinae]ETA03657.1 ABC-type nitrate/sulfonate/bicarbonate transport system, permease component [Frankia sp. CcI6]EYT93672.1 ABC-type nitrate/sulfonate/bicarbonate transport system, permease component [Frankia casuarinae]KDA43895.1 ABC-type nitrate/sulfonate/bicarbonate transport system, permease component [Frankia sp. BMG5.23]KEZ37360.1 ABC-type nitrate
MNELILPDGVIADGRTEAGPRGSGGRRWIPPEVRRFTGPALLFAAWWTVTGFGLVSDQSLASPAAVFGAGRELWNSGELLDSLGISLYRCGVGLILGVTIGLTLAVIAGFFRAGQDVVDSAMNFLRTIPVIALLPLIIVWIGIGEEAKIFLITVGVSFPIYMNTYSAIRGVDIKLVEAGQTFGLGRFGLIRRVIVPGALPGFLVGLRWALGVAWLLLVFAEQVNTDKGIGYLLNSAQSWNRTDIMVLCLVIYGILGLVSDGMVRILERTLLSWRRGFDGT